MFRLIVFARICTTVLYIKNNKVCIEDGKMCIYLHRKHINVILHHIQKCPTNKLIVIL